MNFENLTAANNSVQAVESGLLYQYLDQIRFILENYVNRAISGTGILLNLFFLCTLLNKKLKHKIYNFFWARSFCNLVVCIFGLTFFNFASEFEPLPLYMMIFRLYINGPTIRAAFLASTISDILLILNRHYCLDKKVNCFTEMAKKLNIFICYAVSISFMFPFYFAAEIRESEVKGTFYWKTSSFGSTMYLRIYAVIVFLIENFIPVVLLLIFNVKSTRKFRALMAAKALVQQTLSKRAANAQKHFTKYILVLSMLSLVAHIGDTLIGLVNRLTYTRIVPEFDREQTVIRDLCRQGTLTFMYALHAFEGLIYLKMDANLKTLIRGFFYGNKVGE